MLATAQKSTHELLAFRSKISVAEGLSLSIQNMHDTIFAKSIFPSLPMLFLCFPVFAPIIHQRLPVTFSFNIFISSRVIRIRKSIDSYISNLIIRSRRHIHGTIARRLDKCDEIYHRFTLQI